MATEKTKRWSLAAELRWVDHSEWFDSIKEAKDALRAFIGADLQWFGRYSGVFNGRRFRIVPYRISAVRRDAAKNCPLRRRDIATLGKLSADKAVIS